MKRFASPSEAAIATERRSAASSTSVPGLSNRARSSIATAVFGFSAESNEPLTSARYAARSGV